MNILLADIGIPGGTTTIIAAAGFFFILLAATYVMFRLLRKTVKVAFRAAMVFTVLFMFVVGGTALYFFNAGSSSKPSKPERTRQR